MSRKWFHQRRFFGEWCCPRHRRCVRPAAAILPGLLVLTLVTACRKTETHFEVLAFRDPASPERCGEDFEPGSFAIDSHDNWEIVFEIPPTRLGEDRRTDPADAPTSAPAPETPPTSGDDPIWVSQLIYINIFWRPRPGRTYAERTQTNATITYCLMKGRDVITYEGGGFVYFEKSRDGRTIEGRIESSDLMPTRAVNEPGDIFGRCRLEGEFVAHRDKKHVVAVVKQLHKRLGPSLPMPSDGGLHRAGRMGQSSSRLRASPKSRGLQPARPCLRETSQLARS